MGPVICHVVSSKLDYRLHNSNRGPFPRGAAARGPTGRRHSPGRADGREKENEKKKKKEENKNTGNTKRFKKIDTQ